ncbi:MAG: hypothetical protein R2828_01345 [Saprospiraceae bacterium]
MPKYLYGAVVHGIQSFIFDTGKLKEIVGASEYIEQLCTSAFEKKVGKSYKASNQIIGAAGKIQYLFEDKNSCEDLVYDFFKSIQEEVPGLNFSQAVVKVDQELEDEHTALLEQRLAIQKNKARVPHGLGWMITERARRTGGSAVLTKSKQEDIIDRLQNTKEEASKNTTLLEKLVGEDKSILQKSAPKLFEDLLNNKETGWIAVVHADGNNLGKVIQEIKDSLTIKKEVHLHQVLKELSSSLDSATRKAAEQAYQRVIKPIFEKEKKDNPNVYLPIRPVLLGGDDITIVIRGELALDFTAEFLQAFSHQTRQAFLPLVKTYDLTMLEDGLTACAGIAYIKYNFPFHYGVNLSESLCKYSKTHSKAINLDMPPSSLTFHRVQSSFVEDYADIIEREMLAHNIYLNYGPYFLHKPENYDYDTIKDLQDGIWHVSKDDAPKASLRTWLKELKINPNSAEQLMDRIMRLNNRYVKRLRLGNPTYSTRASKGEKKKVLNTHLFDIISLASIKND